MMTTGISELALLLQIELRVSDLIQEPRAMV